jgi:hypothetical protein
VRVQRFSTRLLSGGGAAGTGSDGFLGLDAGSGCTAAGVTGAVRVASTGLG